METCLSSITYCVSLPHLVLLWFPLHGKAKGKTKRVLSLVTCMKWAQIDGSCSMSYHLSPQFHWWDPLLLLRNKSRLYTNASEGRIKNHCTLSEAKWVFKLANKKVMRNACSPEPPKENQQMPATMQTLSMVGSGVFQTRHRGLVGITGENDKELHLLEDLQGKMWENFSLKAKTEPIHRAPIWNRVHRQAHALSSQGGKPPLDTAWSPLELSNGLTGFLLQLWSSRNISQGYLQVWVQVLPSHPQVAGGMFYHHTWCHEA